MGKKKRFVDIYQFTWLARLTLHLRSLVFESKSFVVSEIKHSEIYKDEFDLLVFQF